LVNWRSGCPGRRRKRSISHKSPGGENDLLTDAHGGDIRADLGDFAGDIAAWDVRKRNRILGLPRRTQRSRCSARKLSRGRGLRSGESWVRSVGVFQDLRSAVLMEEHRLHRNALSRPSKTRVVLWHGSNGGSLTRAMLRRRLRSGKKITRRSNGD